MTSNCLMPVSHVEKNKNKKRDNAPFDFIHDSQSVYILLTTPKKLPLTPARSIFNTSASRHTHTVVYFLEINEAHEDGLLQLVILPGEGINDKDMVLTIPSDWTVIDSLREESSDDLLSCLDRFLDGTEWCDASQAVGNGSAQTHDGWQLKHRVFFCTTFCQGSCPSTERG